MEKERAQFIKDPYRFTKSLLGEAKSGKLMSPNEEVQELIEKTFSDPSRTIPFEEGQELGLAGKPATDLSRPKWWNMQDQNLPQVPGVSSTKYTKSAPNYDRDSENSSGRVAQKAPFKQAEQMLVLAPPT